MYEGELLAGAGVVAVYVIGNLGLGYITHLNIKDIKKRDGKEIAAKYADYILEITNKKLDLPFTYLSRRVARKYLAD